MEWVEIRVVDYNNPSYYESSMEDCIIYLKAISYKGRYWRLAYNSSGNPYFKGYITRDDNTEELGRVDIIEEDPDFKLLLDFWYKGI